MKWERLPKGEKVKLKMANNDKISDRWSSTIEWECGILQVKNFMHFLFLLLNTYFLLCFFFSFLLHLSTIPFSTTYFLKYSVVLWCFMCCMVSCYLFLLFTSIIIENFTCDKINDISGRKTEKEKDQKL